jgi:hypothetical protein
MSNVAGAASMNALKARIRRMPLTVAHAVAQRAAPATTGLTDAAFDSGRTVYGEARPEGADGRPLSLRRTGATRSALRFVANGTIVRCALGTRYARYLIGKYRVLPNGGLPIIWRRRLEAVVAETKVPP